MEHEIWKDIPNFENIYQASNFGRIKSLDRIIKQKKGKRVYERMMKGKILKTKTTNSGYLLVHLSNNGKVKAYTVHKLVYKAFHGVFDEQLQINHVDGNKMNNSIENLELVTQSENIKHSYRELNHKKPRSTKVMCIETEEIFNSVKEAADKVGTNRNCIFHMLSGLRKKAAGYTWKRI